MFENTTVTSNGQVSVEPHLVGWAAPGPHRARGRGACAAWYVGVNPWGPRAPVSAVLCVALLPREYPS